MERVVEPVVQAGVSQGWSESSGKVLGLFDLLGAGQAKAERLGEAHALQLAMRAFAASLVLVAIYGAAAGCTDPMLVWQNPLKLPMVLVLALLCSLPLGALAWKLAGTGSRLVDLLVSVATGVFTSTVVLACGAPLIALYYLTTEHVGGVLVTMFLVGAILLGVANGVRAGLVRRAEGVRVLAILVPHAVTTMALMLALLQLIFLASPIIPESTVWDGGVEQLYRSGP
jgi:hypothetical protein